MMLKKNKPVNISAVRHLYPFKSHYMNINGLKYHFLDEGGGEPIVMLHGNPTWSFYFRELVKGLRSKFRVIAPDHIGCGLSDKPGEKEYGYRLENRIHDVERLIDHLELKKKITLILHDWGGMIGMGYSVKYPEKIGRIVIMNTAGFLRPETKKLPLRLRLARNFRLFAIPAILGLNLFVLSALFMAPFKKLAPDVKYGLRAPYNCPKNRIATLKFVQDIPLTENHVSYGLVKSVDENLHKLSHIPMLICWGEHDFVFDADYLAKWQLRFPDAKTHTFSDAGHYLLEDVPDKILNRIKNFLD